MKGHEALANSLLARSSRRGGHKARPLLDKQEKLVSNDCLPTACAVLLSTPLWTMKQLQQVLPGTSFCSESQLYPILYFGQNLRSRASVVV